MPWRWPPPASGVAAFFFSFFSLSQVPQLSLLLFVGVGEGDNDVGQLCEVFQVLIKSETPVCHCAVKVVQVSAKGVHHFIGEFRRMVGGAKFYGLLGLIGCLRRGGDAAEWFSLLPPNVDLTPVCDVDLLVGGFPEVPLAGGGDKLFPLLGFVQVII